MNAIIYLILYGGLSIWGQGKSTALVVRSATDNRQKSLLTDANMLRALSFGQPMGVLDTPWLWDTCEEFWTPPEEFWTRSGSFGHPVGEFWTSCRVVLDTWWGSFEYPVAEFWTPSGSLGHLGGDFGYPVGEFWTPCGGVLDTMWQRFGHPVEEF